MYDWYIVVNCTVYTHCYKFINDTLSVCTPYTCYRLYSPYIVISCTEYTARSSIIIHCYIVYTLLSLLLLHCIHIDIRCVTDNIVYTLLTCMIATLYTHWYEFCDTLYTHCYVFIDGTLLSAVQSALHILAIGCIYSYIVTSCTVYIATSCIIILFVTLYTLSSYRTFSWTWCGCDGWWCFYMNCIPWVPSFTSTDLSCDTM